MRYIIFLPQKLIDLINAEGKALHADTNLVTLTYKQKHRHIDKKKCIRKIIQEWI